MSGDLRAADDITTWKAAYLSLLDSWTALCEWADVEGDSSPAEVYAAARAKAIPEGAVLVTEETLAAALHKQFPSRWNETTEHAIAAAILRHLREGT